MKPSPALVAIFVSAIALLCALGFWQLQRAEQKRARFETYSARLSEAPVDFELLGGDKPQDHLWRRTGASGRYLEPQVLVDNRVAAGKAGYEVLTPFRTEGGRTVLVNRGWVATGARRDDAPPVPVPAGVVTLRGFFGAEPVVGIRLPGASEAVERLNAAVIRIQRPEIVAIGELLGQDLWPTIIYLEPGAPGALRVEFVPPGDGSAKHTAYAVQWFSMAAIVAGVGLWLVVRRPNSADA